MKKRLPFILVILLFLFVGGFVIYKHIFANSDVKVQPNNPIVETKDSDVNNVVDTNNESSISSAPEVVEEEKLELQEEKEVIKNNDVPVVKEETSKKQETTTNKKVEETTTPSSSNSSNTNSNNTNDVEIEEPKSEEKQEIIIPEEESTPQVDPEYERLKSLIKYKTDMECYYASFDVSLEYNDDENFKVISCSSYAYKGELLGYRMVVHYWDGTTEYLDAID